MLTQTIQVPSHMKLVESVLVPVEYNEAQTDAYVWMKRNGYTCNASHDGFNDFVHGRHENPFSVISDTIRAMRWRTGYDRAKTAA